MWPARPSLASLCLILLALVAVRAVAQPIAQPIAHTPQHAAPPHSIAPPPLPDTTGAPLRTTPPSAPVHAPSASHPPAALESTTASPTLQAHPQETPSQSASVPATHLPAHQPAYQPAHQPTPAPPSRDSRPIPAGHASQEPAPTEAIDHVFVPLKEWKQRKLEDIELRVRKINGIDTPDAQSVSPSPAPRQNKSPIAETFSPDGKDVCVVPHHGWEPHVHYPRCVIGGDGRPAWKDDAIMMSGAGGGEEIQPHPSDVEDCSNAARNAATLNALPAAVLDNSNRQSLPPLNSTVEGHLPFGPENEATTASPLAKEDKELPSRSALSNQSLRRLYDLRKPVVLRDYGQPAHGFMEIPVIGDIMRSIREVSNLFSSSSTSAIPAALLQIVSEVPISLGAGGENANQSSDRRGETVNGSSTDGDGQSPVIPLLEKERDNSEAIGHTSSKSPPAKLGSSASEMTREGKPFNFASADAGARILSASKEIVGAKNVIQDSVDKYFLAPCTSSMEESRWIEIELSEDIILESVEVGNFEFYSSSATNVVVLGAGTYPPTQWNLLGVFGYTNVRTLQSFRIQRRVVTRYLRILFIGKQGQEYYCPVSTIRALGKNLIADWKTVFENKVAKPRVIGKQASEKGSDVPPERPGLHSVGGHGVGEKRDEGSVRQSRAGSEPLARTEKPGEARDTPGLAERPNQSQDGKQHQAHQAKHYDSGSRTDSSDATQEAKVPKTPKDDEAPSAVKKELRVEGDSNSNSEKPGIEDEKYEFAGEAMSEEDQVVLEAVRADALSSGGGDDNIFRKVTRLIRMLELNQTLTNQYIDTHLSRFATALKSVKLESSKFQQLTDLNDQRLLRVIAANEQVIQDFRSYSVKRDALLCILITCVAFLLGTHWVLWTAVGGTRLHTMERVVMADGLPETFSSETDLDVHMQPNGALQSAMCGSGRKAYEDLYQTVSLDSQGHSRKTAPVDRPRSISATEISTMTPHTLNTRP